MKKFLLALTLLLTLFSQNNSQYILQTDQKVNLNIIHTSVALKGYPDQAFYSGVYSILSDIKIADNYSAFIELPIQFSSFSFTNPFTGESIDFSDEALGNILFGARYVLNNASSNLTFMEFSLRVPTARENRDFFSIHYGPAFFADILVQEKFNPELLSVNTNILFINNFSTATWANKIGLKLLKNVEYSSLDTELFLSYGSEYKQYLSRSPLSLGLRLQGLCILTEDIEDIEDRFIHSLEPVIGFDFGRSSLQIEYKIYLDDEIDENIDSIFNFAFTTTF
jgi:hypothetical protein